MPAPVIDAHQHFWDDPRPGEHPWLSGSYAPIRRAFGDAELRPNLDRHGVARTVLVQTTHTNAETCDLLRRAARSDRVAGVVGWIDLTDRHAAAALDALRAGEGGDRLVGIRHLLHHEADPAWIARGDVAHGLALLAERGLVLDLVGRTEHLPAMIEVVRRHRTLRVVLDHMAKPPIRTGVREPWATLLAEFAATRSDVWCKLSGMVTEADWSTWRAADLAPYVAHALDQFGVERCMFGSDWPVCLVAGSYGDVLDALRTALPPLDDEARALIFGRNAIAAYRLPLA